MATETLQASGVGTTYNEWTKMNAVFPELDVNQPDDDATSYITSNRSANRLQMFSTNTPSIPSGSIINSITVFGRCQAAAANGGFKLRQGKGASQIASGTTHTATATWMTFSSAFTTKPDGTAWTVADLVDLEFGIENTTTNHVRCTTLYVVIDYTAAAPSNKGGGFFGAV